MSGWKVYARGLISSRLVSSSSKPTNITHSSARNYMIYQRGTKGCFDQWAAAVGDQSYTFDALLPYFKKSVTFTAPGSSPSSSRFHNSTADFNPSAFSSSGSGGGPLQVSYPNYAQPFSTWLEPALKEIGVDTVKDFNSGELLGCQYCSCTIDPKTEKRASSQNTFLKAAKGRRNLKVYYLSRAKKVVFNDDKKATGVVVASDDVPGQYVVRARKEVILSAGAFQSPQLLMVSGIGPKDELEKFGIPVIKNLPGVGQGMQDHVFFGPTWYVNPGI